VLNAPASTAPTAERIRRDGRAFIAPPPTTYDGPIAAAP
jgi:hypothetical protein